MIPLILLIFTIDTLYYDYGSVCSGWCWYREDHG